LDREGTERENWMDIRIEDKATKIEKSAKKIVQEKEKNVKE
jgi:hypothetical protein